MRVAVKRLMKREMKMKTKEDPEENQRTEKVLVDIHYSCHLLLKDFFFLSELKREKKTHKQAVKEEKREKRKNKIPKHVKKRKEKIIKTRHGK